MIYENLIHGIPYILKCKEKDLTHNLQEFYKYNVEAPLSEEDQCVFSNGEYFYMMFIYNGEDLDLHGEILDDNSK